MVSLEFLDV